MGTDVVRSCGHYSCVVFCILLAYADILFNLLVLLTLCGQIEKLIGSLAYTIVFMAGGIGGNLLGSNFGLIGQPALGASGAIYTFISFEIVDLVYNWNYVRRQLKIH